MDKDVYDDGFDNDYHETEEEINEEDIIWVWLRIDKNSKKNFLLYLNLIGLIKKSYMCRYYMKKN